MPPIGWFAAVSSRAMASAGGDSGSKSSGHMSCPFCTSYDVTRLYLGSLQIDSCECCSCGARWDEDTATGQYLGRAERSSVLAPRTR